MVSSTTILLQGGTLLLHDENKHVVPTVADLLVEGSIISKIGQNIQAPQGARVIDCKNKLVSPGFIDTHRHMWQSQLGGIFTDHSLLEYMPRGNAVSIFYTPEDLFYGQLAGALESIEAGTTTVVDHSQCNSSPDHPQAAVQASLTAGLRTVYCYSPIRRLVSREPFLTEDQFFSEEDTEVFRALAQAAPYGNGRVHVGYALDNVYAPAEVLKPFYAGLRDAGKGKAKVITTHALGGPPFPAGFPSVPQLLASHGLLGPDVLLSHACFPKEGDGALLAAAAASVSTTPNTELQMGEAPVALLEDHHGVASLGVDCGCWGVASMPGQMRLLLQAARLERGTRLAGSGLWSRRAGFRAEQVFNLATLGGARAAGMQGEVGALREGYKADVVVFDASGAAMLTAALEDPVGAVVMHSSPADVDLVLVDGVVRKQGGKLLDVAVEAAPAEGKSAVAPGTTLAWRDVAAKLLESRAALKRRFEGLDFATAEDAYIKAFYMNREVLLEDRE